MIVFYLLWNNSIPASNLPFIKDTVLALNYTANSPQPQVELSGFKQQLKKICEQGC